MTKFYKILKPFIHSLILTFLFVSCDTFQRPVKVHFTGEAQGTYYAITYYEKDGKNYQKEIDSLLKAFDMSVSLWIPNSIISRVNNNDTSVILDEHFISIFKLSQEVSKKTDGAFDVTIGTLVNSWGFGSTDKKKIDKNIIYSLLTYVNYEMVSLEGNKIKKENPNIKLDFNAIAQGYSVDMIGKFLESKGIKNYLIDIGGEVLGQGTKPNEQPWIVGIQRPTEDKYGEYEIQSKVQLVDKAFVTSGSYRKYYEKDGRRYSHTINPKTGYPVTHSLLSVSVLADDAATADAYATTFMVMGLDKALQFLNANKNLDAFFIYSEKNGDLQTFATEGINEILAE
ncbi:MAG: FAD:protein FMN transferase [Bacteroidetes bacterium]|nr:FAD:protein FMN transferase [Bacteroidota bacterium]